MTLNYDKLKKEKKTETVYLITASQIYLCSSHAKILVEKEKKKSKQRKKGWDGRMMKQSGLYRTEKRENGVAV